jgi:hypothetical protein
VTAPWDRRSPEEQRRVADLVLARWLPLVTSAAPMWERRAAAEGLEPRELTSLEALAGLPPAREADLLASALGAPDAVLRPSEEQVKSYGGSDLVGRIVGAIRREGASGKRRVILQEYQPVDLRRAGAGAEQVVIASSRSDLDRLNRVGARAAALLGLDERDVLLSAVPLGPTLDAARAVHLGQGASITTLHARGHGDDLEEVARAAALVPASALLVDIDDALDLARTLAEHRVALPRLERVVLYGPPPEDDLRHQVADAFGSVSSSRVEVRALWGPPFGRTMWAECAAGQGLHTTPDLEHLEVLDPITAEPTTADGDLTLTTLGWHGTALLRLRTGTWVDPLQAGPCPGCGRTVPRLVGEIAPWAWQLPMRGDDWQARTVDLRGVPAVLQSMQGVTAWRAEVRGPNDRVPRDRLLVEVAGDLGRAERSGLEPRLEAACGIAVHLTVGVHRDEVERAIDDLGGVFADLR